MCVAWFSQASVLMLLCVHRLCVAVCMCLLFGCHAHAMCACVRVVGAVRVCVCGVVCVMVGCGYVAGVSRGLCVVV